AQSRSASIKNQLTEILGALEPRIEKVSSHFKVLFERSLPGGNLRIEQLAELVPPGPPFATIRHLQTLAIIRQHRKKICARFGALSRPHRFQQAGSECSKAKHLQTQTNPPCRARNRSAITPK